MPLVEAPENLVFPATYHTGETEGLDGETIPFGQVPGPSCTDTVFYTVEWLHGDGSVAETGKGEGQGSTPITVLRRFQQAGAGSVRVTAVTAEGVSSQGSLKVEVQAGS